MDAADNMRFMLEVARSGSVGDAARRLEVDRTTVVRRIASLERTAGERIFDRLGSGWQLTQAGRRILPYAEAVDAAVTAALVERTGHDDRLRGTFRLIAPDGFGAYVLTPKLGPLCRKHSELSVEVVTATAHAPLTIRDFDLAVTLEQPSARSGLVRQLATYKLGLYASSAYLRKCPPINDLNDLKAHLVIWYVETLLDVQPLRFLDTLIPGIRTRLQTNNIAGHHQAVRAGLGVAPLPTYIGEPDDQLIRILPEEFSVDRQYWELVPTDIARLAKTREMQALINLVINEHPHLTGPSNA